jgi:hypothetical protein
VSDPRPHLRALVEATAPGGSVLVPREWILAMLDEPAAGATEPPDLTWQGRFAAPDSGVTP